MRLRSLLVVLLLAAACGGDDDADVADATTTTAAPVVNVEPRGLEVSGTAIAFGTAEDDTVAAVAAVLGEPDDVGAQDECPAGPATFARFGELDASLLLTMQDGALVGWSIAEGSTLTSAAGIGIGSTKAELEAAYGPVEVIPDSSLGIEAFIEDGVSVLLSEDAPDGAITALWAGVTCIFR